MIKYPSDNLSFHSKEINMRKKGYYIRGEIIYVKGVVNGELVRRTTGLSVSAANVKYVSQKHRVILREILMQELPKVVFKKKQSFKEFGLEVLEVTSANRDIEWQKEVINKWTKNICPEFEHLEFQDIRPMHIEAWQNKLLKRLNPNTIKRYTGIFRLVMRKAFINELLGDFDPCDKVDFIKGKKPKKRTPYTQKEMQLILENASGWIKIFLCVAFGTGMRTGELIALKWEDIDFDERIIKVGRSINHGRIKTTKTQNERFIDMLDGVFMALCVLKQNAKSDEWVFPNKFGNHFYDGKNIRRRHLIPLFAKIGVEYKTLYATRHSFASFMLNGGMDLLWVQNTLGHQDSSTTLKYYSFFQKANEKRIKKANKILNIEPNLSTQYRHTTGS